ncbi:type II toxin-antitoxin system VapC family toxin [soil metagenome]|nr:type II toxin-antitoxin system VapC family toxin [Deinococcota bacterium]
MRYLLDTHALAWAVSDPGRLSDEARALLRNPGNALLLSPASIWEMSIKHRAGKWPEVAPFMDEAHYARFSRRLGARELCISSAHARLAGGFSVAHKDPFDRLLAAQSMLEGVALISKDAALDAFPITRLW